MEFIAYESGLSETGLPDFITATAPQIPFDIIVIQGALLANAERLLENLIGTRH